MLTVLPSDFVSRIMTPFAGLRVFTVTLARLDGALRTDAFLTTDVFLTTAFCGRLIGSAVRVGARATMTARGITFAFFTAVFFAGAFAVFATGFAVVFLSLGT